MYDNYRDFISKYISLNIVQWELFKSKLKKVSYKKGEIILNIGDVSSNLLFIHSGLARAYIIDENGKDYTWSIFFNDRNSNMTNLFVVDYHSFCTHRASSLEIEALEDCVMIELQYDDMMFLYDKLRSADRFGRLMAEEAYGYLHQTIINKRTQNAQERFEEFMRETPFLLDRVPQYHIATLLDISPQHLSRLKKSMNLC